MEESKNVFFKPFIGKNYFNKGFNGVKLLVLGESHYCGEKGVGCKFCGVLSGKDCSDKTNEVISDFLNYKSGEVVYDNWMRTFTTFTNVIFGEPISNEMVIDFWNSVVFYNYVQSSTDGPRIPPDSNQFNDSINAFIEILEECKPDLIIVWGKRLWNYLPDIGREGNEKLLGNDAEGLYYYKVGEKEIPAYRVDHPSTPYFSYEYTKYIEEAIRLAKK